MQEGEVSTSMFIYIIYIRGKAVGQHKVSPQDEILHGAHRSEGDFHTGRRTYIKFTVSLNAQAS